MKERIKKELVDLVMFMIGGVIGYGLACIIWEIYEWIHDNIISP